MFTHDIEEIVVSELLVTTISNSLANVGRDVFLETDLTAFDFDSLDKLEMVMSIEDKLGIVLPEQGLEECKTVGQLVAYCEKQLRLSKVPIA